LRSLPARVAAFLRPRCSPFHRQLGGGPAERNAGRYPPLSVALPVPHFCCRGRVCRRGRPATPIAARPVSDNVFRSQARFSFRTPIRHVEAIW
jgi:hypothetical protein